MVLSLLIVIVGVGCSGGGSGSGSSPTAPPIPVDNLASASFRLSGAGYSDTKMMGAGSSLVFCRRNAGWADLWVRFAEQRTADGETSPHLDLDLCNYSNGGSFDAIDAASATCGAGPGFDIWWHDGNAVFNNDLTASACQLILSVSADVNPRLSGEFSCSGLRETNGTRSLDVLDGSFECTVE